MRLNELAKLPTSSVALNRLGSTVASRSPPAISLAKNAKFVIGAVIFHWSAVVTTAIGCVVVMVMKGPGYVADGMEVSHSDKPRRIAEGQEP